MAIKAHSYTGSLSFSKKTEAARYILKVNFCSETGSTVSDMFVSYSLSNYNPLITIDWRNKGIMIIKLAAAVSLPSLVRHFLTLWPMLHEKDQLLSLIHKWDIQKLRPHINTLSCSSQNNPLQSRLVRFLFIPPPINTYAYIRHGNSNCFF